jgi:crotonobetainyl-CoA:carnitine CoA-transferase CaiB-like acyl-CoA transferase
MKQSSLSPYRVLDLTDENGLLASRILADLGEPGKQPLRIPVPQIYFHAGSWAAAGAMIAFTGRTISGEGQYVDASMLEAAAWSNYSAAEWWSYSNLLLKREGTWRQQGLSRMRLIFDCKDGYVLMFLLGGTMATIGEYKMVEWMEAEGKCPDWLKGFNWEKLDVANVEQKFFDDLADAVAPFLLDKTKKQLFDWAMENELFLAPVNDTKDLLDNPQLKSRKFWIDIEHDELNDRITYPGPFAKMSETPIAIRHRAPLIGEHNTEIYHGEFGIPLSDLITLKQAGII